MNDVSSIINTGINNPGPGDVAYLGIVKVSSLSTELPAAFTRRYFAGVKGVVWEGSYYVPKWNTSSAPMIDIGAEMDPSLSYVIAWSAGVWNIEGLKQGDSLDCQKL